MLSEMSNLTDERRDRKTGLLDRVPGWLILAVVVAVVAAVLLFTTWQ
jgi:type VI protein secretion system component VasF